MSQESTKRRWIRNRLLTAGIVMLALGLTIGAAIAAEEVTIQVDTSAEQIFVGDSVEYHVVVRNAKNPPVPDLTAIKQQFDVLENGNESRNQTSITVINGKMSQQNVFSHVYRYRLTPKSAGDLTIPAVTVTIDGKTITSDELSLKVTEPEKQDLVLVEIETSHQKVYPTQPFIVTARVLVRPLPNDSNDNPLYPLQAMPPHLDVNWVDIPAGLVAQETNKWLQPLLAEDGIGFVLNNVTRQSNSFLTVTQSAVFDLSKGREVRDGLDEKPVRYFVYELTRTFTPEKAGEYSFGPAIVKGTFVTKVEKRRPIGRQLIAIASPKIVEVREVPSPRPDTYCGGIGEYKVTASASPTALRVGDPVTLTLEFERGPQSGSLELIAAPDLSAIPALTEDFELVDKNPTGRVEGSVKKFAFALRPKRANVQIPPLSVATFDPQSEKFVERKTAPILLEVSDASRVSAGDLVGGAPSSGSTTMKTRAQGIFQNITDPAQVRDERINLIAWSEIAAGIWFAAGCLIAFVTSYRRRSSDAVWIRRLHARKTANQRLAEAKTTLAQGNAKEAFGLVRLAVIGIVADLTNRITEGLTTADVASALTTAAVPEEDRSAVLQLLESIESTEYGGASSTDPAVTIGSAAKLISRILPYLERGS